MTQPSITGSGVTYLAGKCPQCRETFFVTDPAVTTSTEQLTCPGCSRSSGASSWKWLQTEVPPPEGTEAVEARVVNEAFWEDNGSVFLRGTAIDLRGVSGLAKGPVLVEFAPAQITLTVLSTQKQSTIGYDSVTSLQFAGRGEYEVSSNFQIVGGGFGLAGAAKGILEAEVANSVIRWLTRRKVIETLVGLAWDGGSLLLLTDRVTPEALARRCAEVVRWIEGAHPTDGAGSAAATSGSLAQQLRELGELRDAGVLSEDEFAAAKAKLLN